MRKQPTDRQPKTLHNEKTMPPCLFRRRLIFALIFTLLLFSMLACRLEINHSAGDPLEATLAALHTQISQLGETQAALLVMTPAANDAPQPQQTLAAIQATATAQAELAATLQQEPAWTPAGTASPYTPDERLLKSARILLFEDMSASRYIRIAKQALDDAGYFYQDVGSATGWFRRQLLADQEWDLIIASGEANRGFGGEFFELIDQRVAGGSAAIIETWDLDQAPTGKASGLLNRCGLKVESDWFEPDQKTIFILQPDYPLFQTPNRFTGMLRNSQSIWSGDFGDLLKVDTGRGSSASPPVILAGSNPSLKSSHGLLSACLGGRVILQTFRTHEYRFEDMVALWQNYVFHALRSYYADNGRIIPTPKLRMQPTPAGTPTPYDPTPGPEYLFPHACAGTFMVRLIGSPIIQRDLFEHHAAGDFLTLRVSIQNTADFPIMIWDRDYFLEARVGDHTLAYRSDPAATGYLRINQETSLIQGIIQPGETWVVALAFDIDRSAKDPVFVFRPGSRFNEQVCEARLSLER